MQRLLFGPLAAIAKALGHKGTYPKYIDSGLANGGNLAVYLLVWLALFMF